MAEESPKDPIFDHFKKPKVKSIHQFLRQHGILYNDKYEVIIHQDTLPGTIYPLIVYGLRDHKFGYQTGMKEVLKALPSLPKDICSTVAQKLRPPPPKHLVLFPEGHPYGKKRIINPITNKVLWKLL